jgi:hypothetical protein
MQADPSASPSAGLRGPHPAYASTSATADGATNAPGLAHATTTAAPGGTGGVHHANPFLGQSTPRPGAVAMRGPIPGSTAPSRAVGTLVTGQYLPSGDAGIDRMRALEFALKLHGAAY